MLDVPPSESRLVAVGSRTHTPPIPVSPIGEVVAALAARRGPVADLVPTQAAVAEPIVDEFIAFGGDVVIGFCDFAAGDASGSASAGLQSAVRRLSKTTPALQSGSFTRFDTRYAMSSTLMVVSPVVRSTFSGGFGT